MSTLTYADYLQIDTLLSLQQMRTPATADRAVSLAEQLFIITHQSCELWVKQVVADLDAAAHAMTPPHSMDDLELSAEFLARTAEVLRLLHDQLLVLEKLPIRHFAEFRPNLDTASGVQSAQFRQLSMLFGSDRGPGRLFEAFAAAAAHQGLSIEDVCRSGLGAGVLHRIAELLLEIGNAYWHWKLTHLALVSMMVGGREGTNRSSGVDYLARRVSLPFPELRQERGLMHEG